MAERSGPSGTSGIVAGVAELDLDRSARRGYPEAVYCEGKSDVQVREIAETKKEDLNANDIDAAAKIIAGTARSMGIEVE